MNRTIFKAAASTLIVSLTMVVDEHPVARDAPGHDAASMPTARTARRPSCTSRRRATSARAAWTRRRRRWSRRSACRRATPATGCCSPTSICARAGSNSARATFADVLELDPSNNRAGLSFALTQIALGRPAAAVGQLEQMAGNAPAADVGLALRSPASRSARSSCSSRRARRRARRRACARISPCPMPSPATGAAPARSPRRICRRPI